MMKQLFTLVLCGAAFFASAQELKLETGRKYTVKTDVNGSTEMAMMGQMEMKMESTFTLDVKSVNAGSYAADFTTTKMKMNMTVQGQDMEYDSDKKDNNADIEEQVGKLLNKVIPLTIDSKTGVVTTTANDTEIEGGGMNPMSMGGSQSPTATAAALFLIIPSGKKPGDTWSTESAAAGLKTTNNYTYVSANGDIATVKMKSSIAGTTKQEINGQEMDMTIKTTADSDIEVRLSNGLVDKSKTESQSEMSMEIMGQSLDVTTKQTSVTKID